MTKTTVRVRVGPGMQADGTLITAAGLWYFKYEGDTADDWRIFQALPARIQDDLITAVWGAKADLTDPATA